MRQFTGMIHVCLHCKLLHGCPLPGRPAYPCVLLRAFVDVQLAATHPVLQSSVSAKWHEWHRIRSQSPEPFHRPLAQKFQPQPSKQQLMHIHIYGQYSLCQVMLSRCSSAGLYLKVATALLWKHLVLSKAIYPLCLPLCCLSH